MVYRSKERGVPVPRTRAPVPRKRGVSALGQGRTSTGKGYPATGTNGCVPRQRGTRSPDYGIIVHRKKAHVRRERGARDLGNGVPVPRKRSTRPCEKVIRHPGKGKTGFGKKGVSDTRKRLIPPSYKGSAVPLEMCPRPSEYRWPVARNEGTRPSVMGYPSLR